MLLYKNSAAASLIEKDIARWIQIRAPERAGLEIADNLIWLLKRYPEFRNIFYFRLGKYISFPGRFLLFLTRFFYKPASTLRFFMPVIGAGLYICYGFGTIIAGEIGENCTIGQGVAIGYKDGSSGVPTIGNNVFIGAGSKILGRVHIGDNVIIGANSVVIKDIPSNCTAAGVPARIIKWSAPELDEDEPIVETLEPVL